MQRVLLGVDQLSTWLGQAFAWSIVLLTFGITWEVFSRYALGQPHDWNLNVQIMLYGTLFMMAGAYTLAKNNHVRGDVLYGFFRPRTQAWIDLVLYVLFFLPGIVALTWAGWTYFDGSAGDPRADLRRHAVAAVPVQVRDPDCRRHAAAAGPRRDRALRAVHP